MKMDRLRMSVFMMRARRLLNDIRGSQHGAMILIKVVFPAAIFP